MDARKALSTSAFSMSLKRSPTLFSTSSLGLFDEAFHVPLHFQNCRLIYFALFTAEVKYINKKNPNKQGGF